MACIVYIQLGDTDERLGQFKDREKAEDFFRIWKRSAPCREAVKAIYVETGKGRGKR